MPYLLQWSPHDHRHIEWSPFRDQDGKMILPKKYYMPKNIPDKSTWPIRLKQVTKHKVLPDICPGLSSMTFYVSKKLKEMIEEWDPVAHVFVPLEITVASGEVQNGSYFMFKFGSFIEGGLVEDKSDVARVSFPPHDDISKGEFRYFESTKLTPKLTWYASKIAGRHIWADSMLDRDVCISDEFAAELKAQKIKHITLTEGYIEDDFA